MSDPIDAADAAASTRHRWGVWDRHTLTWAVSPELRSERAAWAAKLDVNTLWPWELEPREDTATPQPEQQVACPECMGSGVCDGCQRDCTRCDGHAEVPVAELADHERRRLIRLGYLDGPAPEAPTLAAAS